MKEDNVALLTKTNPITELDSIMAQYATPSLISQDQFRSVLAAIRDVCIELPESELLLGEINDIATDYNNDELISKMKFFTWYLDLRSMVKTLNG